MLEPRFMCGIAYLVRTIIATIFEWNVERTLSGSMSAMSGTWICLDALLMRTSSVLYFSRCLSTTALQLASSRRSPGTRRHWRPSFSIAFLTSSALSLATSVSLGSSSRLRVQGVGSSLLLLLREVRDSQVGALSCSKDCECSD